MLLRLTRTLTPALSFQQHLLSANLPLHYPQVLAKHIHPSKYGIYVCNVSSCCAPSALENTWSCTDKLTSFLRSAVSNKCVKKWKTN